jgi:hypothetical protein
MADSNSTSFEGLWMFLSAASDKSQRRVWGKAEYLIAITVAAALAQEWLAYFGWPARISEYNGWAIGALAVGALCEIAVRFKCEHLDASIAEGEKRDIREEAKQDAILLAQELESERSARKHAELAALPRRIKLEGSIKNLSRFDGTAVEIVSLHEPEPENTARKTYELLELSRWNIIEWRAQSEVTSGIVVSVTAIPNDLAKSGRLIGAAEALVEELSKCEVAILDLGDPPKTDGAGSLTITIGDSIAIARLLDHWTPIRENHIASERARRGPRHRFTQIAKCHRLRY